MTDRGAITWQLLVVGHATPTAILVGTSQKILVAVADNVNFGVSIRRLRNQDQVALPETTLLVVVSKLQDVWVKVAPIDLFVSASSKSTSHANKRG